MIYDERFVLKTFRTVHNFVLITILLQCQHPNQSIGLPCPSASGLREVVKNFLCAVLIWCLTDDRNKSEYVRYSAVTFRYFLIQMSIFQCNNS